MTITRYREGSTLTLILDGWLDTANAPRLNEELGARLNGVTHLILDLEGVEYMSTAGLRVVLAAKKQMNRQGRLTVKHVNPSVMEIMEVTGFVDILDIQ